MTASPRPLRERFTLLLIVGICVAMAALVPAFHTYGNLTVVGQNAAFIGIMACGEGLVILSAGLDLSVGAILAVCCCVAGAAMAAGYSWPVASLAGLAASAAAGLLNGALITYRKLPPILTTLATM